jgi:predicted CXXCH cytochrome family protein
VPIYQLVGPAGPTVASPHSGYSLTSPDCAACHATHTAQASALGNAPSPQSGICFTCHAGSGSTFNVAADFSGVPANNPATSAWYSHPATTATSLHTLDSSDEFGGTLNRHAVCADCHSPHDATADRPAQSTTGWTASGDISGASAVSIRDNAAGTAPAYTLVGTGVNGQRPTYEYDLCLKCHSGRTVLPTQPAAHPSWWALDKGIELNPANASYHPVSAAGRNLTAQMAASLIGTSPFKAWDLSVDSTIRCTQCHGDPSTVNQTASAAPKRPAPDAYEASHASPNRGLLIAPYLDRALKASNDPYNSADFGLCYLCHAERPFKDPNENPSAPDTNFSLHGAHMTAVSSTGTGLSIDTPGAGEGLPTCAECHFRIHSTAIAYKPGDTAPTPRTTGYASLVDFAPNVTGVGTAPPAWAQPDSAGVGSCTLTCHGAIHLAKTTSYTVAPGTGFTATPTTGPVGTSGLVVQFDDASRYVAPSGATWTWDFGDGTGSSLVSPSHTYAKAGTYTVVLTVQRTVGNTLSTTMTRTNYITVTP